MLAFSRQPSTTAKCTTSPFDRPGHITVQAKRRDTRSAVATMLNGRDFSLVSTHAPAAPRVQTKLTVGATNDPLEHEADRVAEQIMRMPEPKAPGACGCSKCGDKADAQPEIRLKAALANDHEGLDAPTIVHDVLRSPGRPLDAATRAFFEPRLGHDFSSVRVHADALAAKSAHAMNARAYTAGRDIAFGSGAYAPSTRNGRILIAHELAHVVQQRGGNHDALRRAPAAAESAALPSPDWNQYLYCGSAPIPCSICIIPQENPPAWTSPRGSMNAGVQPKTGFFLAHGLTPEEIAKGKSPSIEYYGEPGPAEDEMKKDKICKPDKPKPKVPKRVQDYNNAKNKDKWLRNN